jgi:hypothetical protein
VDSSLPPLDGGCGPVETGVVNGSFEQGTVGFCSGYEFIPRPTLISAETEYTVASNPSQVSIYQDWGSFGDHTSGHGLMLIGNGATATGVPVWYETVVVQPNATYTLSFWGANVDTDSQSLPMLEGFIDGDGLGGVLTLPQAAGQWTQYTATWSSGSASEVTLSIIDLNTRASWNDFAVDDVAFGR